MRKKVGGFNINLGTVALTVGGLAALAFLVRRASAFNPVKTINVEVYSKKTCDEAKLTPTGDEPTDTNVFTYDVVWRYTEVEVGKPSSFRVVDSGRVATVSTSRNSAAGLVNIAFPINQIPDTIKAANIANGSQFGYEPNTWTTSECVLSTPCHANDCCVGGKFKVPWGPTVIEHKLSYYILESKCLDCHYTSCQDIVLEDGSRGQEIPKGGGTPAVFKYHKSTDACAPVTGCSATPEGGCWYTDQYGQYRGKCYIIIR